MKREIVIFLFVCALLTPALFGSASNSLTPSTKADAIVLSGGNDRGSGSLTTIFAANGGGAGNMFDIEPDIYLTEIGALDVNWSEVGESIDVHVYYKEGTSVGFETDPNPWSLLAVGTGIGAGYNNPTFIDLSGNGVHFEADTVYGLYVHVENYPDLNGHLARTNGGPNTYSNSELSLTTNCSNLWPAFDSRFYPRIWNGTIYYETVDVDLLDIKINGQDGVISIPSTGNATLTIDIIAGEAAGVDLDVWVLASNTNSVRASYSLFAEKWFWGWGTAYYSGPLSDWSDTVLDRPLPINSYMAWIALEANPDGRLDMPDIFDLDFVVFHVVP